MPLEDVSVTDLTARLCVFVLLCRRTKGSWRRWGSACGRRSWCPTWVRWTLRHSTRSWRRATRLLWKTTGESLRGLRHRPDQTLRCCWPGAHPLSIQVVSPVCTKSTSPQTLAATKKKLSWCNKITVLIKECYRFMVAESGASAIGCSGEDLSCFPADVDTVEEKGAAGGWDFLFVPCVQSHCVRLTDVIFHRW